MTQFGGITNRAAMFIPVREGEKRREREGGREGEGRGGGGGGGGGCSPNPGATRQPPTCTSSFTLY